MQFPTLLSAAAVLLVATVSAMPSVLVAREEGYGTCTSIGGCFHEDDSPPRACFNAYCTKAYLDMRCSCDKDKQDLINLGRRGAGSADATPSAEHPGSRPARPGPKAHRRTNLTPVPDRHVQSPALSSPLGWTRAVSHRMRHLHDATSWRPCHGGWEGKRRRSTSTGLAMGYDAILRRVQAVPPGHNLILDGTGPDPGNRDSAVARSLCGIWPARPLAPLGWRDSTAAQLPPLPAECAGLHLEKIPLLAARQK
ncbi:hypothetical protein JHW43_005445 [Diplocarpon mali]|nr:hypothetical protein JHW43_005445 [Diplocarpon mali]